MKKYLKKNNENNDSVNYWLSIGDLMAGILIIFILLFVFQIHNLNNSLREKEADIEELTAVKNKIIAKLKGEFEKEDMRILIDPISGAIILDDKILFDVDEYKLKKKGKDFLNVFIPKYINILLGNKEIKDEISQIILEGHTDDLGSYIYNLNLSQMRAFEVIRYIYEDMPYFPEKEDLKNYITANGRSETQLIYTKNGNIDREKSRRVVFKFKLKEEELIEKIRNQLLEGI